MSYSGLVMHGDRVRDHVEQAQEGERHGFSGGWVTEVNEPDAITVLAAAAASTERFGWARASCLSVCATRTWRRCRSGRSRT